MIGKRRKPWSPYVGVQCSPIAQLCYSAERLLLSKVVGGVFRRSSLYRNQQVSNKRRGSETCFQARHAYDVVAMLQRVQHTKSLLPTHLSSVCLARISRTEDATGRRGGKYSIHRHVIHLKSEMQRGSRRAKNNPPMVRNAAIIWYWTLRRSVQVQC
jgi:hypothetical protein